MNTKEGQKLKEELLKNIANALQFSTTNSFYGCENYLEDALKNCGELKKWKREMSKRG